MHAADGDPALTERLRDLLGPRHPVAAAATVAPGDAATAALGADLVRDRLTAPLGLTGLYAPATAGELRASALPGRSRRGRPRAPWTGEAVPPAGGLRAPITAMARLTGALLDGSAPGVAALDPVARFSGRAVRIGAAWITLRVRGRDITWRNGATGGFRSWLGLDRDAGAGVVLLSATCASLDAHGFRLLSEVTGSR